MSAQAAVWSGGGDETVGEWESGRVARVAHLFRAAPQCGIILYMRRGRWGPSYPLVFFAQFTTKDEAQTVGLCLKVAFHVSRYVNNASGIAYRPYLQPPPP